MVTDSDNRIRLAPISEGMHRPLWSVMIPTFHCARFLHQTLESVLSQNPGADVMQIEVVDDCSNDNTSHSAACSNKIGQVIGVSRSKGDRIQGPRHSIG
jgi:cellulose synthase/poly-beta-1,6-N-acetylglucosamine synthase-like glycosyltransferase